MKLNFGTTHITIDDNSEEAKKIRDGYNFNFQNGKIKINDIQLAKMTIKNKWQAIKALEKINGIDPILKDILNFILNNI